MRAEVVKLVDAVDSKSTGPCAHAGSIPAFGTTQMKEPLGSIATMQYSMIMKGISGPPVYLCTCVRTVDIHPFTSGIFIGPENLILQNQNLWRYKCPSDILQSACA